LQPLQRDGLRFSDVHVLNEHGEQIFHDSLLNDVHEPFCDVRLPIQNDGQHFCDGHVFP